MSQNTTLEAVLAVSQCAIAIDGEMTILVERSEDTHGGTFGYWYDVQRPAGRVHNFCFDFEITRPEDELAELGIDTTALTWQPTDRTMDFSTCVCADCKSFCLAYNLMPRGLTWYEAIWYRAIFTKRFLAWQWTLHRLWLRDAYERIVSRLSTTNEGGRDADTE